jgi:CO/xanthine dehydrogenase Mo-binding subunit
MTPDLATYILPTSLDAPAVECHFVEAAEPSGPYGMKGAGEVAIDGPLPAVANALADACGRRAGQFPLTPERVLALLREAGQAETRG